MKSILNDTIEHEMKLIMDLEYLKECFELRLSLLGKNYSLKDEFERNEIDIKRLRTEVSLNKLNLVLNAKKNEFKDLMKIYCQELEELRIAN
jgi:hypothetical protein